MTYEIIVLKKRTERTNAVILIFYLDDVLLHFVFHPDHEYVLSFLIRQNLHVE